MHLPPPDAPWWWQEAATLTVSMVGNLVHDFLDLIHRPADTVLAANNYDEPDVVVPATRRRLEILRATTTNLDVSACYLH